MHTDTTEESAFRRHESCPSCGSRDNLGRYSDGPGYCFGCGYYETGEGGQERKGVITTPGLLTLDYIPLARRKLDEATCKFWDYGISTMDGRDVQVATYRNPKGVPVAQKVRTPDKKFKIVGDSSQMGLFGMHLWPSGGKMVVVVEGEVDALSVSQVQNLKYPVVSVPHGARTASKYIGKHIDWLTSFESVILMFDADEPGREAAVAAAEILPPGKAKIAQLPLKDASAMLQAGRGSEIIPAIWQAKEYRPDGIVFGHEMWEAILHRDHKESVPYPWAGCNSVMHGIREGALVVLTSGTGVGKSSVCREIAHHLISSDKKVGYIALEESVVRTSLGLIGVELSKPVHLDHVEVSEEELKRGYEAVMGSGKLVLYDHFGSMDNERLLNKVRQMVRGWGCTHIIIDHLSIVVSQFADGDERRRIDAVMTKLRSLVAELGVSLILVSHLKRNEGKSLEEGGRTSLSLLRGSASIAQLADIVVGLERSLIDDEASCVMTVRTLKNRYSGETGVATYLKWDKETGRLTETTKPGDDDDSYGF